MSDQGEESDVATVYVRQYVGTELVTRDGVTVGNFSYYI